MGADTRFGFCSHQRFLRFITSADLLHLVFFAASDFQLDAETVLELGELRRQLQSSESQAVVLADIAQFQDVDGCRQIRPTGYAISPRSASDYSADPWLTGKAASKSRLSHNCSRARAKP
jgi:hypothetical protein